MQIDVVVVFRVGLVLMLVVLVSIREGFLCCHCPHPCLRRRRCPHEHGGPCHEGVEKKSGAEWEAKEQETKWGKADVRY